MSEEQPRQPGICECGHAISQHTTTGCIEINGKCSCLRHRPGSVVVGEAPSLPSLPRTITKAREATSPVMPRTITAIPEMISDHEALIIPRTITRTPYDRFMDVRRSPERRALYDRVLLRRPETTIQDQITFALDELREANYVLPPTCEVEGRVADPTHASACVQRAMAALRSVRKMLGTAD